MTLHRIFYGLVLIGLIWLVGLAAYITTLPAPSASTPDDTDAVVVYTGGGGARIIAAMSLFADGTGERMLISGVNEKTSRTTISELWSGAPERFDCCVDLGFEARTTIGNADEAALWSSKHKAKRIVLVTSDYHMPRAMTESRVAMPDAEITPYVVASGYLTNDGRPISRAAWSILAGEYSKLILAKAQAAMSLFN